KSDFSGKVQPDTSTPVKVIVGVNDPALSADVMEQTWLVCFPEAEMTILPDAGHYPMFESPVSLATSVEEFLGRDCWRHPPAGPDTEVVFDPATYTSGVPFEALARLRRHTPVTWVPEIPVLGWPEGPGFWLVLRHADVESVMRQPDLFSSALGATQIRDPATP